MQEISTELTSLPSNFGDGVDSSKEEEAGPTSHDIGPSPKKKQKVDG